MAHYQIIVKLLQTCLIMSALFGLLLALTFMAWRYFLPFAPMTGLSLLFGGLPDSLNCLGICASERAYPS